MGYEKSGYDRRVSRGSDRVYNIARKGLYASRPRPVIAARTAKPGQTAVRTLCTRYVAVTRGSPKTGRQPHPRLYRLHATTPGPSLREQTI